MTFTVQEIELMLEALTRAASRLESLARASRGHFSAEHDRKAAGMRKLRVRLMKIKTDLEAA